MRAPRGFRQFESGTNLKAWSLSLQRGLSSPHGVGPSCVIHRTCERREERSVPALKRNPPRNESTIATLGNRTSCAGPPHPHHSGEVPGEIVQRADIRQGFSAEHHGVRSNSLTNSGQFTNSNSFAPRCRKTTTPRLSMSLTAERSSRTGLLSSNASQQIARVIEGSSGTTLRVEGRIVAEWVAVLERE
jgi:hypothetical protein